MSARSLVGRLAGSSRADVDAPVVVHVGWGGPERAYDLGHIPGAIHVDTDLVEADERCIPRRFWRLLPGPELVGVLGQLGITERSSVVVYGAQTAAAARFAWALGYAGVREIGLLDGGLDAWIAAGGAVERVRRALAPQDFGAPTIARPELVITHDEVRARLDDPSLVLADVRAWDEYVGARTGYSYVHARGRLPGARYAWGGPDVHTLEHYHEPDGTLRDPEVIRALWAKSGITPDREVAFYCGTGWRASVAFLFACWLGYERPRLFDGGWLAWTEGRSDPNDPIERGAPDDGAAIYANSGLAK
ncbi:sulfurtransferase [Myxococcota bacterium]|nr:sulfurtransferase [Myxococcota bacterium]